jgi:PST family polysaccharide transporter
VPHRKTIAIVATTAAGLVSRASSLLSQAIVGIYLTEAEVGLYAASLGIMGVTGIWRNGGSATYLPSATPEEFRRVANPMFLWALCFGLATALLTAALAAADDRLPDALAGYQVPGLQAVLLVMALRSVIFPVAVLGRMRLYVEHQFTMLAKVDSLNAIFRLALTWVVAAQGGGALALAVPYTASVVVEIVAAWLLGGYRLSDFAPAFGRLRSIAPLLAWPLVLAVLMSIRADVSFLLIGVMLPAAALGIFYFAFQLANQPTMLLAMSLQNVLAPMLARSRGQQEAERIGLERVFAMAMLFVPVTTMAAASIFPSAEQLVWGGKWASAAPSVTVLCIGSTYATVAGMLSGPLIGLRRFRESAGFELMKMVGIIGGAAAGAGLMALAPGVFEARGGDVTSVSACVAAGMVVTSIAQLLWVARQYRFPVGDTIRNLTFGPLLAGLTAVASQSIGHSLFMSMGLPPGRASSLIEFSAISSTYLLLIGLSVRFTAEPILRDTVDAFPPKLRTFLAKAFALR